MSLCHNFHLSRILIDLKKKFSVGNQTVYSGTKETIRQCTSQYFLAALIVPLVLCGSQYFDTLQTAVIVFKVCCFLPLAHTHTHMANGWRVSITVHCLEHSPPV